MPTSPEDRRRLESLDRDTLEVHQRDRLNSLLNAILPFNRFYAEKLATVRRPVESLNELLTWPYTFKEELIGEAHEHNLARNLTWHRSRYARLHQTSGTRGRPMIVLDSAEDWPWWLDCWQYVLDAADVQPGEACLFAFSFGPFIGFWSAFDAAIARGCLAVPGGGINTRGRIDLIERSRATAVFCTPSYALHMAEVAAEHKVPLAESGVRTLVLAGEPGGSVPAVRQAIEQAWQARVIDHAGASEVGPWGFGDSTAGGIYVNEAEFIAEFLSTETGGPAVEGELAELVLTTLGRTGAPVIRYRTGDLVRPSWRSNGERTFVFLEGGVLGRADDMLIVRGVNIFPSSLDQVLRSFPEIVEYRITARTVGTMDTLSVEIEDRLQDPGRVASELQLRLGLKVDVINVALGSLPRSEGKSRRFVDERAKPV